MRASGVLALAALLAASLAFAQPPPAGPAAFTAEELQAIADSAGGLLGVSAVHVESGRPLAALRAMQRFPMASVYKLPIAVAVLSRVDRGELRLDSLVTIAPADYAPARSPLAEAAGDRTVALTVDSLLAMMVSQSDNTACDVLIPLAGGPAAITARMNALGIAGIRVDRPERAIALDQSGLEIWPAAEAWSPSRFAELASLVPDAVRREARRRFTADPRDTATPTGLVELLVALERGRALSPASRERLLDWMSDTSGSPNRIGRGMPPGTRVAHKSGTWLTGLATNDVALVTLPDASHLAMAVFITRTDSSSAACERVIARLGRAIYDRAVGAE